MKNNRFNSLITKSLLTSTSILLSFLFIYKLVNNNKQFNQQYTQTVDQLASEFPSSQSNKSSQKLDLLLVDLGLKAINSDAKYKPQEKKQENFDKIRNSLNDFLLSQSLKNTTKPQQIPDNLQQYLRENQENIHQIRELILNSEIVTWHFDITDAYKINPLNIVLPNFLGIIDLQRIFQLQILVDNQQGNSEAINQTLEASLKLNQATQKHPYLISQIVSRIVFTLQDAVIRQVSYLSPKSQKILDRYDYNFDENMIKAFNLEIIMMSSPLLFSEEVASQKKFTKPWLPIMNKLIQVNHQKGIKKMKQAIVELEKQNICSVNIGDFVTKEDEQSWFNVSQNFGFTNEMLLKYWAMGGNTMLDRELTKQIVAAKLAYAQTGEYPQNLYNQTSDTCPQNRWKYQEENKGLTISFNQSEQITAQRKKLELYTNNSIPSLSFDLFKDNKN